MVSFSAIRFYIWYSEFIGWWQYLHDINVRFTHLNWKKMWNNNRKFSYLLFFENLHIGSPELRDILGDLLKSNNILIVEYDSATNGIIFFISICKIPFITRYCAITIYESYNVIFKLFNASLLTRKMVPTTA